MPEFEYTLDVLTSGVSRSRVGLDSLNASLERHGTEGWELVTIALEAKLKGNDEDGHLLIFKRVKT
ncbi:MAG: DUF4177 domain-containing protein [Actinomycetota bacterium]